MSKEDQRRVSITFDAQTATRLAGALRGNLDGLGRLADACNNIDGTARAALVDACNNIDASGLRIVADACNNVNLPGLRALAVACNNIDASQLKAVARASGDVEIQELSSAVDPLNAFIARLDGLLGQSLGADEIAALRQRLQRGQFGTEDVADLVRLTHVAEELARADIRGRQVVIHLPFGMDLVK